MESERLVYQRLTEFTCEISDFGNYVFYEGLETTKRHIYSSFLLVVHDLKL